MQNPKIKTKVLHSRTKSAWNVLGDKLGAKYKIARVPYLVTADEEITSKMRAEALLHAEYISFCFNNSDLITKPSAF